MILVNNKMRNLVFLLGLVLFFSCKKTSEPVPYIEPAGEPENYTVIKKYSLKGHKENNVSMPVQGTFLVNMNYFGSGDSYDSTGGWYSAGKYTAQDTVKLHIKLHCWIANNEGSSLFYITKGNNTIAQDVSGVKNFSGVKNIEAWEVVLYPGEYIQAFVFNQFGSSTIYTNGSNWGQPTDYSYFLVEAYQ